MFSDYRRFWTVRVAIAFALLLVGAAPAAAATVPDGYVSEPFADIGQPIGMEFTPDGRLLVTEQRGALRVVLPDGTVLPEPALDLTARTCDNSERGMLGVEVGPDFALTGHVFIFWTVKGTSDCAGTEGGYGGGRAGNRVSRFTMVGNVIDPSTEVVLLDRIPNAGHLHNAGDLEIAKDGKLWVTVGDGGCNYRQQGFCGAQNSAARDRHALVGKVLRINVDGTIPEDNPFAETGQRCGLIGVGSTGVQCQETWASGLRNPFRFAFDPNASGVRFFINDVGQSVWEEVDEGVKAADYGWNLREGFCAVGSRTDCKPAWPRAPLHAYDHRTGCTSIVGGAFVPAGAWAPELDGDYLYADFTCGKVFQMEPAGTGWSTTEFASGLVAPTTMIFGPDDALYIASYGDGITRFRHVGTGNRPPTARLDASPRSGALPLEVTFDGTLSTDPEGGALVYLWDFGDGETAETTTPTTTHTYTAAGSRTATLRVRDPEGVVSAPVTVSVDPGNTAPTPVIASPSAGATFTANGELQLQGSATDAEDGALPGTSLSWEVRRYHGAGTSSVHYHPWHSSTGATATILGPEPEDLDAATTSYLEVRLTATDSRGLRRTVTREIQPRIRALTVTTDPPGLPVRVNEATLPSPVQVSSWPGTIITVGAEDRQRLDGRIFDLTGWSDGGGATHSFTMPDAPVTATATYAEPPPGSLGLRATYFDEPDFTGVVGTEVVPQMDFQWGYGGPAGVTAGDYWSARYEGTLVVPETGTFRLYARADDAVNVYIDGELALSSWSYNPWQPEKSTQFALDAGLHDLRIDYVNRRKGASLRVSWLGPGVEGKAVLTQEHLVPAPGRELPTAALEAAPATGVAPLDVTLSAAGSTDPAGEGLTYLWDFGDGGTAETTSPEVDHTYAVGTFTASVRVRDADDQTSEPATAEVVASLPPSGEPGIRAEYFGTVDLTGPSVERVETTLEHRWGYGAPPGITSADSWSARYTGRLRVPQTGSYTLYGRADDGVRVYVDGRLVISQWTLNWLRPERSATMALDAGEHELVVEYVERTQSASLRVAWLGPGLPGKVPIAGEYLAQPPG